jgi:formate C-acetyltransferase
VYCHNIAKYKNMRIGTGPIGCGWYASTVTLTANIPAGEVIGALPSGRLSGRPLADGISPVHGSEKEGPTAVVNSVSKLSNILVTGGQLLNMRFIPQMLKDKKGLEGILNLMKVFFEQKGWHIQFNVISTDILRKAQKQPEEYRDLVIRVAGYSALFVSLDPKVQEDIISRTQYEIS